ncbi:MAG: hypothetical protein ABIP55_00385, partial [Tepidisphaeraceae bacterium]
ANDFHGIAPRSFDLLLATQDVTSDLFTCASSNDIHASGATTQAVVQEFLANPKHCSYIYSGPARLSETDPPPPPDRIVAYEPLVNHDDAGMNVLYEDGSVAWLDEKTARHVLAELIAGHNPPRLPTTAVSQ